MKYLILFVIIIIGVILLSLLNSYAEHFNFKEQHNNNIYIDKSKIGGKYGRGVFANKKYNKNDIIEEAPYIKDKLNNFNGISRDYVFNTPDGNVALGFGYTSLYNHSDKPNATWYFNDDKIIIKSNKLIEKNHEILISYGNDYWKSRNLTKITNP